MTFQPGQSGNPAGRPPKSRALTTLLEKAGNKTVEADGRKVARKRLIAELAWQILVYGRAKFPDGTVLEIAPKDWIEVLKWVYTHIDGPAKQGVELSTPPGQPFEMSHRPDLSGLTTEELKLLEYLLTKHTDTG